jgi:hypothetical protein
MDIAVMSRAVLVLEDHLSDEHIKSDIQRKQLCDWIENIEAELQRAYSSVNEDFEQHLSLSRRSSAATLLRSASKSENDIYQLSIAKCLLLFNPYRLKIAQDHQLHAARIYFLEMFFFACQLLDDFQDLIEDRGKRLNHNLFLAGRSRVSQDSIINTRFHWLAPLLEAIKHNLVRKSVCLGTRGSAVLQHFHGAALTFLDKMMEKANAGENCVNSVFYPFEDWRFDPLSVVGNRAPQHIEAFIRPEFLQTYSSGIRHIQDV